MSLSHREIAENFWNGASRGKGSRMFIEKNILYSHGHHFPLLVRRSDGYLMNADRYSVSTSKHQSICSKYADFLIPFSILSRLNIDYQTVRIIDQSKEVWETREYKDKDGNMQTVEERRPSALIMANPDNGKRYLASMDNNRYFASELSKPVKSVEQAFDLLKPIEAKGIEGTDYLRQGEWFFIPVDIKPLKSSIKKGMVKKPYVKRIDPEKEIYQIKPVEFLINRNKSLTPHHYTTEYGFNLGCPLMVRGTVRHTNHDHKMLKLGNRRQWYMAVESNHVLSVGAGRVD